MLMTHPPCPAEDWSMNIHIQIPLLIAISTITLTASADDDHDGKNHHHKHHEYHEHHYEHGAKFRFEAPIASPGALLEANPARLLASNCYQCHGTFGTGGFEDLSGNEAEEIVKFRAKEANRNIMAAHAQGYTPQQIEAIIDYFAANP
jgi:sulfide dehydrogenase cytochrome subunit